MDTQPTIIKIRRGINGFRYSACDKDGYFIGNLKKLSDARRHYKLQIKWDMLCLSANWTKCRI